jgi:hypothetical protein
MNQEQRETLLAIIRYYLNHLWTRVAPSPERNGTIRVLQMLKGRLVPFLGAGADPQPFELTEEERRLLKRVLDVCMRPDEGLPELRAPAEQRKLALLRQQLEQGKTL